MKSSNRIKSAALVILCVMGGVLVASAQSGDFTGNIKVVDPTPQHFRESNGPSVITADNPAPASGVNALNNK